MKSMECDVVIQNLCRFNGQFMHFTKGQVRVKSWRVCGSCWCANGYSQQYWALIIGCVRLYDLQKGWQGVEEISIIFWQPPVYVLAGLAAPKQSWRSLVFLMTLLSAMVEYMPEKTVSRLTAFLARTLAHLTHFELSTMHINVLRSIMWFWTNFCVSSFLAKSENCTVSGLASSLENQANSNSSGNHFLDNVLGPGNFGHKGANTSCCPPSLISCSLILPPEVSPCTTAWPQVLSCRSSRQIYILVTASIWSGGVCLYSADSEKAARIDLTAATLESPCFS